jgi:hypothetical protein
VFAMDEPFMVRIVPLVRGMFSSRQALPLELD